MGMMVYSVLWVMQGLYHQPQCAGIHYRSEKGCRVAGSGLQCAWGLAVLEL